jgi:hypothetical protein
MSPTSSDPGCDTILSDGQHQVFNWNNPNYPFRYNNMVRIGTSGVRQSCFFHAVLRAIDEDFGKLSTEQRENRARQLREELAEYLTKPVDPRDPNSPIVYNILSRGELTRMSEEEELSIVSLDYIRSKLLSNEAVGQEVFELASMYIDRDIYVLDCASKDVFRLEPDIYYKGRKSIVLLNHSGPCEHFETVGIFDVNTGVVVKEFQPQHEFISAIRSRLGLPPVQ